MASAEYLTLDGGTASTLVSDGHAIEDHPLWSASLLKAKRGAIKSVAQRFLNAGADVIETCTYQASIPGLVRYMDVSLSEATSIIQDAVQLVREARDEFLAKRIGEAKDVYIVGSVGPYGAALADDSEYSGNYADGMTVEALIDWHLPRMQALTSENVDLIAAETIPALKEVDAICKALRQFPNTKAWVTCSLKDSQKISHGETFADLAEVVLRCPQVSGKTDKKIVIYPNSGELWENKRWTSGPNAVKKVSEYCPQWIELGANWIGGCCRTTPNDVKELKTAMQEFLRHH